MYPSIGKKGLFLVLTLIAIGNAAADDEGVIKYRRGVMKAQAGYMAAMGMVVQGRADYAANLADHAAGLHALSKIIPTLFPAGSDFGETNALDKIWKNPDDFKSKAEKAETATADLVTAARSGDRAQILDAYKAVGQSCKGCHEDYRQKKN